MDTTGAGEKAQRACDAETDRDVAYWEAWEARQSGDYQAELAASTQVDKALRNYYKEIGTPLPPEPKPDDK